jgi:hypothetical protein
VTPEASAGPIAEPTITPPSTAGMTTKVVKGSMWTLAGQVAPLLVSLVTTPFVIRMLGSEGYGVLILIGLIPTYFSFSELGMGIASTRFASEAYARGDLEGEARAIRTAEARRILKTSGTIYKEVPNIESLSQRISGEFWLHWDCPRHLYGFSPQTLRRFIERNGFTSITVKTFRAEFYEADIKYKREDECNQKLVQTVGLSIADKLRARALKLITSLYCKIYRETGDYICVFARKEL